jgi:hypothetical protein
MRRRTSRQAPRSGGGAAAARSATSAPGARRGVDDPRIVALEALDRARHAGGAAHGETVAVSGDALVVPGEAPQRQLGREDHPPPLQREEGELVEVLVEDRGHGGAAHALPREDRCVAGHGQFSEMVAPRILFGPRDAETT